MFYIGIEMHALLNKLLDVAVLVEDSFTTVSDSTMFYKDTMKQINVYLAYGL